ncbi:sugar phosphate nucleotidyltransferase [Desulfurivibrio sp. D14AmB]|uniref:sugar phosphate nucleotidyltransferase n=1 Tax=Desulfurivibrio sp. D14AmB TaxID=3374370 RepID=UPI00376F1EE4
MENLPLYLLVLAAGKGTRMRSTRAKVLHELFFAPMIDHVLDAVAPLRPAETVVVVGHQRREVQRVLATREVKIAVQEEQNGTAHAVLAAADLLAGRPGTTLILCGDTPLIRPQTLENLLAIHGRSAASLSVLSARPRNPFGYGRMVCDPQGCLLRIVEEKDASEAEKEITEVNAGVYCVANDFLFQVLGEVGSDNRQNEMYLTDIVEIAVAAGRTVRHWCCPDADEMLGVNSRVELARAHALLQQRRNRQLMESGVTLLQPETALIAQGVEIGPDTIIAPGVEISGQTRIGPGCRIDSFVKLHDCILEAGAEIPSFSNLHGARVAPGRQRGEEGRKMA